MKSRLILYGLALTVASVARADYNPIALTPGSYNADVVVEKTATPHVLGPFIYTTASMDGGTNNNGDTWFEAGFFTNNPPVTGPIPGLPAAGTVITSLVDSTHLYQFAPSYTANNAIMLDNTATFASGSWTFITPTNLGKISWITSGGNGGATYNWTVRHLDGTIETGQTNSADWFATTGQAFSSFGRINAQTFTLDNYNQSGGVPCLFPKEIVLTNTTSPVTNVTFTYVSSTGGHTCIMAISGQAPSGGNFNPIAVTGYNADIVVEAAANPPRSGDYTNYVTVTMDNGTNVAAGGNTWYEQGLDPVHPATGLPQAGSLISSASLTNNHYTMPASYAANNCIYADSNNPAATITFASPTSASALSFLSANANGAITIQVIIHHTDATTETNTFVSKDWFNGTPAAYIANGRVNTSTRVINTLNGNNPRLYEALFALANTASPVTSLDLLWTTNGNPSTASRIVVFAVSGATGAVAPILTSPLPASTNVYAGSPAMFAVGASGTAPFSYQWQKGTNGIFANLSDGGDVSGSNTNVLNFSSAVFADAADYRLIVTNIAGATTGNAATLTVFSTDADVTQPGDPITSFGGGLFGDGPPVNAIDNNMGTKLGMNLSPAGAPSGVVVSPNAGATLVTALRVYTANDTTARDPIDYKLEGSVNGGGSYTLIASNSLALSDNRNNLPGIAPDPLTQAVQEVRFTNSNGYTTYRLTFSHYKGGSSQGSFQIEEIELLGVNTNLPIQVVVPNTARAYVGSALTINATVSGSPAPNSRWQKKISGVFTYLSDVGTVTGSQTTSLTINPTAFGDAGDFRIIATNSLATVTSAPVTVIILTTNVDVTQPGDPIVSFGDQSAGHYSATDLAPECIDNTFTSYINGGSGASASAGFNPFAGPVGVVVTPAAGKTIITGVRFYPGSDTSIDDPADYTLEGSNNGGASYTTLSSGALAIPDERNDVAFAVDPLTTSVQEILFANSQGYTSYRLTFNHVKDDGNAASLRIGELELLGVVAPAQLVISDTTVSGGNLNITGSGGTPSGGYTVLSTSDLTQPVASWATAGTGSFDGSGNFSISIPVSPANPKQFYLIRTP